MLRLIALLAGLILVPLALVVVLLAGLQSAAVRDAAVGVVNALVPGVKLEGLGGGLPGRVQLDRLALEDADGVWLEVDNFGAAWTPAALLAGRIEIGNVLVERVRVHRLPTGEAEVEAARGDAQLSVVLPGAVPPLRVERLAIGEITLAAAVLGEPASFALTASVDAGTGTLLTGSAELRRRDAQGLGAEVDATVDLAAQTLTLALEGRDASGLVAALTDEPRVEPMTFSLRGDGPIVRWPGRLVLEAGSVATLRSHVELGLPDPLRIVVDGRLEAGPEVADSAYAALLKDGLDLGLEAEVAAARTVVDRLHIAAPWISVEGRAALQDEHLEAEINVDAGSLMPLAALIGQPIEGAVTISGSADGPLPLPPGEVLLRAADLRLGPVAIGNLEQHAEAHATDEGAIGFNLEGTADALVIETGDNVFRERVALTARGVFDAAGPFAIDALDLGSRSINVRGTAAGDHAAGMIDARLDIDMPSLAALRPLAREVPAGALSATLRADLADQYGGGRLTLRADGTSIAELPPVIGPLLGPVPALLVEANVDAATEVIVDTFSLEGQALTVNGTARANVDDRSGDLDLTARVGDLGVLGPALNRPLAGAATAAMDVTGSLDDFAAEAALQVEGLLVQEESFDTAQMRISAAGNVDAIAGELDARLARNDDALTATAAYRATAERLVIDDAAVAGPGASLGGSLEVALDPVRVDGRVAGGATELTALGGFLGVPLAGTADLDATLGSRDGQRAEVRATARSLQVGELVLDQVDLAVEGADLTAAATLDGTLALSGVAQGTTRVETARVGLAGDFSRLRVDLEAVGSLPDPFNVAGEGVVRRDAARTQATLERLDGAIADVPVRLTAPATVRIEGGTINLDGLTLEIDAARLDTRASLGPERVDAILTLQDLDLATLSAFGLPALDGTVGSTWTVSGSRRAPVVVGEARLAALRQRGAAADDGIAINASLDLRDGTLAAAVDAEGLGSPPVRGEAQFPVRLSLQPFALAVARTEPMQGALDGSLDLMRLARWLGLDGTEVDGTFAIALGAAGTLDEPDLRGSARLSDGSVIDVASGVVLQDLVLEALADDDEIRVERLVASDGREGRLVGQGGVRIGESGLDVDLDVTLERFAVLQREKIFVELSGDTGVTGTGTELGLTSRLDVNRGEIYLASPSGARDFPSLDVVTLEELAGQDEGDELPLSAVARVLDLDAVVTVPGRFFVRGRGLDSEWEGEVVVSGDASSPSVRGLIEYRRGHLDVLLNRFQFRRGEIRLTGEFPPDPSLDIEAEAPLDDIVAVIQVTGPALDPDIIVSSNPALPEDEVLARILFGRDATQLHSFQAVRLAAAVNQLRGAGPGVLGTLGDTFGLDTVEIGGESMEDANLRVGTYVSDDVFLEVEQGLKAQSGSARVEVELTPRLRFETRANEDQTGSVGFRWRWDY